MVVSVDRSLYRDELIALVAHAWVSGLYRQVVILYKWSLSFTVSLYSQPVYEDCSRDQVMVVSVDR